jgi:polysaccharide biosynthesis/export protein
VNCHVVSRITGLCAVGAIISGCTLIAKDGPTGDAVRARAEVAIDQPGSNVSYALVKLTPEVLETVNASTRTRAPRFALAGRGAVRGGRGSDIRIGRGDLIGVTIFEASAGGLFIPQEAGSRAGNFVQIPNQQVDAAGNITVPYAGTVHVLGRKASDVSKTISDKLASRAIEPQVVVSIAERRGNDVSVLGEVNTPARFPLDPGGIQILGAIARAGGPKIPPYEAVLTLQRGGQTHQAVMTSVLKSPEQNIALVPGDIVYVSREPRVFLVFGATPLPTINSASSLSRRFAFDDDNLSLADGVARAGGLDNARADARAVFLFRLETRETLKALGIDVSKYREAQVPTVYTVDMTRADGLFLSSNFYMRHKDMIFISDSPSIDLLKFVTVFRQVVGAVGDVANAGNSILDLRAPR